MPAPSFQVGAMPTFAYVHSTNEHTPLHGGSRRSGPMPAISIITAAYNASTTLAATIDSVRSQISDAYEFIIVDGGSKDGTVEVLRHHDAHIDHWVSAPDEGMYDAMNKGAALAKGQYVSFLNADDRYFPHTIAEVVKHMENHPNADVIHGNMVKVKELDGQIYEREERPRPEFMPQGMGIFHPATFVKKACFDALGGYDTAYRLAADYAFFLQLWQQQLGFSYIDMPLAYFSLGGASNVGCGTYREAAAIQERYHTGYAAQTKLLLRKCERKKSYRNFIFGMARITKTTWLLNRVLKRRWG